MLAKFFGFSLIGLIVTLLSLGLITLLIGILKTPLYLSYVGIYLATIFISYFLNIKFTFRSKPTGKLMMQYYAVYISSMGIGVGVLAILKKITPFENYILGYLVLPVTTLYNFFILNYLTGRQR